MKFKTLQKNKQNIDDSEFSAGDNSIAICYRVKTLVQTLPKECTCQIDCS